MAVEIAYILIVDDLVNRAVDAFQVPYFDGRNTILFFQYLLADDETFVIRIFFQRKCFVAQLSLVMKGLRPEKSFESGEFRVKIKIPDRDILAEVLYFSSLKRIEVPEFLQDLLQVVRKVPGQCIDTGRIKKS